MRPEDLLHAMSEIDDDLIDRSDKKSSVSWKPILTMAACFIILLGIGTALLSVGKIHRTIQVALFYSSDSNNSYSYEQAADEALSAYYGDYRLQYVYYEAASSEDRPEQIANAVTEGCKLILLDGRQERHTILTLAESHPKTTFLALGISADALGQEVLPANVICVPYRPEIAGYLAGYTAVKEGYTRLGYYYDFGIPSYFAYGSGYLQGIEAAAEELDITDKIQIRVSSTINTPQGTQSPTEDLERISHWYKSGTQMVLACGVLSCDATKEAAQAQRGDVILVGGRQSGDDSKETISQGIAQILDRILHDGLDQSSADEMPYYTLNNPDGTWGFQNVSEEEFSALRDSLVNGTRPCKADMVKAEDYSIEVLFSE